MTPNHKDNLYEGVPADSPDAAEEFSLEEILAEYGGSRGQRLLREVEREAVPPAEPEPPPKVPEKKPPEEPAPPKPDAGEEAERLRREARDKLLAQAVDLEKLEQDLPRAPRPISLEEVVGSTVDAVMEEREPLLKPRRGLFSRRKLEETEELYARPEPEVEEEPEEDPEVIGPEPEPCEAAADCREEYRRRKGTLPAAALLALLPSVLLAAEQYGLVIPCWSGDGRLQSLVLLACLAVTALLCRPVFAKGFSMLGRKRCTAELLISISALVAAADCVSRLVLPERSDAMPYASVSCLALVFALWGDSRESLGFYDTFRTAAMDNDPPYLITETERGACKQKGFVPGFYTTAMRDDAATW